jgi:hypothetical protein
VKYCGALNPSGKWLCVLSASHDGQHLSIDNTRLWKGTPGYPIRWETARAETPESDTPPFTGRPCDFCQSLNTIQNGKCLLCMDCHQTGECG